MPPIRAGGVTVAKGDDERAGLENRQIGPTGMSGLPYIWVHAAMISLICEAGHGKLDAIVRVGNCRMSRVSAFCTSSAISAATHCRSRNAEPEAVGLDFSAPAITAARAPVSGTWPRVAGTLCPGRPVRCPQGGS